MNASPTKGMTVAYVRTATADASMENQLRRCHEIATSLGTRIRQVYTDRGASGNKPNRASLEQLLADLERRLIGHVIVASPDRLSRDRWTLLDIRQRIFRRGVRLVSSPDAAARLRESMLDYLEYCMRRGKRGRRG